MLGLNVGGNANANTQGGLGLGLGLGGGANAQGGGALLDTSLLTNVGVAANTRLNQAAQAFAQGQKCTSAQFGAFINTLPNEEDKKAWVSQAKANFNTGCCTYQDIATAVRSCQTADAKLHAVAELKPYVSAAGNVQAGKQAVLQALSETTAGAQVQAQA